MYNIYNIYFTFNFLLTPNKSTQLPFHSASVFRLRLFFWCTFPNYFHYCLGSLDPLPTTSRICDVILELSDMGLIIIPDSRVTLFQKISLNISSDDIHYALTSHDAA
uniref:Uncharacterized protein n=1 Tax=Cacopsylla melanoneura TaxID=428564 RepID=A0A8D8QTP9_9HEMI